MKNGYIGLPEIHPQIPTLGPTSELNRMYCLAPLVQKEQDAQVAYPQSSRNSHHGNYWDISLSFKLKDFRKVCSSQLEVTIMQVFEVIE